MPHCCCISGVAWWKRGLSRWTRHFCTVFSGSLARGRLLFVFLLRLRLRCHTRLSMCVTGASMRLRTGHRSAAKARKWCSGSVSGNWLLLCLFSQWCKATKLGNEGWYIHVWCRATVCTWYPNVFCVVSSYYYVSCPCMYCLTRQPLGLRAIRQPLGGGPKVAPFTSAKKSSQRVKIEKRNFAHIFLST